MLTLYRKSDSNYAQCLLIIPALCSMLSGTYYSQNYASIIRPTLIPATSAVTIKFVLIMLVN